MPEENALRVLFDPSQRYELSSELTYLRQQTSLAPLFATTARFDIASPKTPFRVWIRKPRDDRPTPREVERVVVRWEDLAFTAALSHTEVRSTEHAAGKDQVHILNDEHSHRDIMAIKINPSIAGDMSFKLIADEHGLLAHSKVSVQTALTALDMEAWLDTSIDRTLRQLRIEPGPQRAVLDAILAQEAWRVRARIVTAFHHGDDRSGRRQRISRQVASPSGPYSAI